MQVSPKLVILIQCERYYNSTHIRKRPRTQMTRTLIPLLEKGTE